MVATMKDRIASQAPYGANEMGRVKAPVPTMLPITIAVAATSPRDPACWSSVSVVREGAVS